MVKPLSVADHTDSVDSGEPKIHDDNIGVRTVNFDQCILAVCCFFYETVTGFLKIFCKRYVLQVFCQLSPTVAPPTPTLSITRSVTVLVVVLSSMLKRHSDFLFYDFVFSPPREGGGKNL